MERRFARNALCTLALLSLFSPLTATPAAAMGRDLPIDRLTSDRAVLLTALNLPGVGSVTDDLVLRGCVRHPENDAVVRSDSPPATVVFLAFEDPGLTLPAGYSGTPAIMIVSVRDFGGATHTTVARTTFVYDHANQRLTTADAIAGADPRLGTFGATTVGADGGPDRHADPVATKTQKYLGCAGMGMLGCAVSALLTTPPVPQVVVLRAAVCSTMAAIGCLSVYL